jgi:hypothetical protein
MIRNESPPHKFGGIGQKREGRRGNLKEEGNWTGLKRVWGRKRKVFGGIEAGEWNAGREWKWPRKGDQNSLNWRRED